MTSRRFVLLLISAFLQTILVAAADKPAIVGTWKLVSTKYGEAKEHTPYPGGSSRTKIINATHFVWLEVQNDSKTGEASKIHDPC